MQRIILLLTILGSLFFPSIGYAQEVIPPELVLTPQFKPRLPETVRGPFALSTLSNGTIQQIFQSPPCIAGNYFLAVQLFYDLGDKQTELPWTVDLSVSMLNNTTVLWTKPLGVRMTDQTFVSTVFNAGTIACDANYKIKIESKNVTGAAPQNNIYIQFLLYKKFEDVFDPAAVLSLNCNDCIDKEKSLVSWTHSRVGTVAYDLEWVFISNRENFTGTTQEAFLFKEPARITTAVLQYQHPTYYPTGRVWYRARAVGYDPLTPDHRIPGNWFYLSASVSKLNHQPDMTWMLQTSFSEEGKYKNAITYHDQLLFERQVQTQLSSSGNKAIVGESLYDYEGRLSIEMMPVPSSSVSLKYKPSFNQFSTTNSTVASKVSGVKKKFHYDNDALTNSIVSTTSGAGWYYSASNNLETISRDYIPNAEGYVYAQTEYLNDGTGRVKRQAGVGKDFRIDVVGSTNRATKYFYGSTNAYELIRLFGTNVGNARHYKKQMVVDVNGQTSVAYIDQEGRTIATALAGDKPVAVDPLTSYTSLPLTTVEMDATSRNNSKDGSSVATDKILNVVPSTTFTFVYNFSGLASDLQALGLGCPACRFDVTITITDPDGKLLNINTPTVIPGNEATTGFSYERKNLSITECAIRTTALDIQFPVTFLEPGEYTVTKTLTPTELTFEQVKTVLTQSVTIQQKMLSIANSIVVDEENCDICTSCSDSQDVIYNTMNEIADQDCQNMYALIVSAIKASHPNPDHVPLPAEIAAHADYCQYQLCMASRESDVFEKGLSRVINWAEANSRGYSALSDPVNLQNYYPDPLFRNGKLAEGARADMKSRLDNINIGNVGVDDNGDGIQDRVQNYTRSILVATNPLEPSMYINDRGVATNSASTGRHLLYYDLMSKRANMSEARYQSELDKQRWAVFKSFYLEAKRKTLLAMNSVPNGLTAFKNCPKAKARLEAPGLLPTTPDAIAAYGNANYVGGPITTEETEAIYYWINFSCSNKNFSTADRNTVMTELASYFNEKPFRLLKYIVPEDVGVNPHLNAIQTILNSYGCASLTTFAVADLTTCARDTTIVYKNIFVPQGSGNPGQFRSATRSHDKMELEVLAQAESLTTAPETKKYMTVVPTSAPRKNARSGGSTTILAQPPLQSEYDALLALYNATNGPSWTNNTGWSTATATAQDVSGWYGVSVDAQGHVYYLTLNANNLTGNIPSAIGNLTYLNALDLDNNNLTGAIPTTIGNLTKLEILYLWQNQLTGSIPSQIGNLLLLRDLNLSTNQLSGPIPTSIGNLSNLEGLVLFQNNLTGSIPTQIGQLVKIESLALFENQLTGTIPVQLSNLTKLRYLTLDNNQLTGTIPSEFGSLVKLETFWAYSNNLTGSIPSSLGSLPLLSSLNLGYNQLSGTIPDLSGCPNIHSLQLMNNQLTGSVPEWISGLTGLYTLYLDHNQLTGTIPVSICNLSSLQILGLGENQLTGTIPENIGNLSNLTTLYLYKNQLTGQIPLSIGSLTKLGHLIIYDNQLSGTLPNALGNLTQLGYCNLRTNQFSGSIPSTLQNLKKLMYLVLDENMLSGSIPPELGNMPQLVQLSMRSNQLTGQIPPSLSSLSLLQILDVSNNKLSGTIPLGLNSIPTIFMVTVSNNYYTFADILPFKVATPATFYYSPQLLVDVIKTHTVAPGGTLNLTTSIDRSTTPGSAFQWFVIAGGVETPVNAASANGHTVSIPNLTSGDNGKRYYYKITNTGASTLTLISNLQTLITVPTGSQIVNVCQEYDPENTLTFTIDAAVWAQTVQKCIADAEEERTVLANFAVDKLIEEEATRYFETSRTKCLAQVQEKFAYSFLPKEYHYTLYYYDQAGNLVQSVPPEGVVPLSPTQVYSYFTGGIKDNPQHKYVTCYKYNSLDQPVWQKTPDAGESNYWYNDKGQLKLAQNAQQKKDNNYSYTKFDPLGRIIETGELNTTDNLGTLMTALESTTFPVATGSRILQDVTKTYYDVPNAAIQGTFPQEYLRNRVSYTEVLEKGASDVLATCYTYDIHGNVKAVLQQIPQLGNKRIDYTYDHISGTVNNVFYQYGQSDQFIHQYSYDADNRLTQVATSTDGYVWDIEAKYIYHLHGPLARVVLGQYNVQGLDYYYTLQRWTKGVNMPYTGDPGKDGYAGGNSTVGRDVFSYALGYYQNDYKPINAATVISDTRDLMWTRFKTLMGSTNTGLFNSNISWMVTDLKKVAQIKGARVKGMQGMLYKYDQLNRLTKSRALANYSTTGFASRTASAVAYDEDFSYDGNGNILTLKRRNNANVLVDDFTYSYYDNTNRLRYHIPVTQTADFSGALVTDNKVYKTIRIRGTAYAPDGKDVLLKAIDNIDIDQGFDMQPNSTFRAYVLGQDEGGYNYDAIGNLVWDHYAAVRITWTPNGKVRKVSKADGTITTFRYDAMGNRIEKKTVNPDASVNLTRYVRDANGSVMAVYNGTTLLEQNIMGNQRIGVYRNGKQNGKRILGTKQYELSNHLGNVLSVITDNIRMAPDSTWANVVNASDFYAFGSEMPGRDYSAATYRYGFNGKEKDNSGEWNNTIYDYGFRIYNPKIGKFLSVDPMTKTFPWYTPYQFAGNKPIAAIDLDGLEEKLVVKFESIGAVFELEDSKSISNYYNALTTGKYPDTYFESGWEEYVRSDDHFNKSEEPPDKGLLEVVWRKDGAVIVNYNENWTPPSTGPGRVWAGTKSGASIWWSFWASDEEGPRVARKYVFGIISVATGVGALAEGGAILTYTLATTDVVIGANDIYSGTVDATDGKNVEYDLLKDALVARLGPDAGKYFDTGKVFLGGVGVAGSSIKLVDDAGKAGVTYLNIDKSVMNEFLNLYGSALGLSDDISDAYNIREKKPISNQDVKKTP
jgi:RHS repeat-associated protein